MPPMTAATLSKSKVLSGLQCEKRLWQEVHHPERATEDPALEAVMAAGTGVGEVARRLWPDGILADEENLARAREQTLAWMDSPERPLFEGFFDCDGVRIRPDILVPNGDGTIDLFEVKMSTSVKDYHKADVSVQAWVLRKLGLDLRRVHLTHIDSGFVYPGGGDYNGLFAHADLTEVADANAAEVEAWVARFRATLAGPEPAIGIGGHCRDPFPCPFFDHCDRPAVEYPVYLLPHLGRLGDELRIAGYRDLREVPIERLSREMHQRIHRATVRGEPYHNTEASRVLHGLGWPRYHLDFETVNFAVPVFAGSRPYQQIPFQWSCHVEYADGTLQHNEFLAAPDRLPYRDFARTLIATLGETGPILVYNASFERRILRETAEQVPLFAKVIEQLDERIVDLLTLTKESWYHPAMMGSWSLKGVLPTVAPDLNHDALAISGGGEAAAAIAEYIDPATTTERREQLTTQLRAYCALDTLALVRLAHHLEELS